MIDALPTPARPRPPAAPPLATVRDATLAVLRQRGMTTIFGNPGSTEIPFLLGLPDDLQFVLGLHEGSVVGMASGYALARGEPSLVNLHTVAGLGNAVNAIANARDSRIPLVIVVGQQDRRQLVLEPFLTGRALERLAGDYPVWSCQPARAQDVPGAISRAHHEAKAAMGPAIVVVPMGDWLEPADPFSPLPPDFVLHAGAADPTQLHQLAALLESARSPAIVVGGGTDSPAGFAAVAALADRLRCPVWQEPFGPRAGFPQDHPRFAGHLPWKRRLLRETLADHDALLVVGTQAFRLYLLDEAGPPVAPGTRVAVLTDDPAQAHRSWCELAVVAPVPGACQALTGLLRERHGPRATPLARPAAPAPPATGEPLRAEHVLAALAERIPPDAVLVEEAPSSRPELLARIPARVPLGFVSSANGALGFGLPGAAGIRMGLPHRGVVGVIGDGSALYAIQAVWSAAHYGIGVVWIVIGNGGYEAMDAQARERRARAPWPLLSGIDLTQIARGFGCQAVRVETHEQLCAAFDEALGGLAARSEPILIDVAVSV